MTCLDVPDEKSSTWPLSLDALLNNGVMYFVITFPADVLLRSHARTSVVIVVSTV